MHGSEGYAGRRAEQRDGGDDKWRRAQGRLLLCAFGGIFSGARLKTIVACAVAIQFNASSYISAILK